MKFRAKVIPSGNATAVEIPTDVVKALGSGPRPLIAVTVNGHTWRSRIALMRGKLPNRDERRELIAWSLLWAVTPCSGNPLTRFLRCLEAHQTMRRETSARPPTPILPPARDRPCISAAQALRTSDTVSRDPPVSVVLRNVS
jgi:antitoxin component of MazEF toxin-antitoxin module